MPDLQMRGIREQDIDLLLWEELVASPSFLRWFVAEVGILGDVELAGAARSVTGPTGESDLELTLRRGSETVKVFVENKVAAPLQPDQAERYGDRGQSSVHRGECDVATTVLVAPAAYLGDGVESLGFDQFLTYEAMLKWFETATQLGARGKCKEEILREAIDNGGWTLKPDKATTEFWRQYWQRASEMAPELRMPKPRDRPAGSSFVNFRALELGEGVSLLHKVSYGNVDLQFAGMGSRAAELRERYGPQLDPDMRVEPAYKSAVVRIEVPRIDMSAPFSTSGKTVEAGIRAAVRLLALYKLYKRSG